MKNLTIIYNPFYLSTKFMVDGKKPPTNSSLDFPKQRLQEWAEKVPKILIEEYHDKNFSIDFTGTLDDFSDLKEILLTNRDILIVKEFIHHRTPDVSEVEKNVVAIYNEIMNGPVEALKDKDIQENFKEAICSDFTINVVATMSSGKSTLINSIIGTRLLPVGNMATTATIVRIIASDQDSYSGIAFDKDMKEIYKEKELTYKIMQDWNSDESISTIDIYGPIPCVDSVGMRLILMDTPGPNNSRDENHKAMTYRMMETSEKSLVLFVLNAEQLHINDEKYFLDFVCDCMKKGGKQSRDRFIFAVNKINEFDPDNGDNVGKALLSVKDDLDKKDIREPNIFPVNALTAFELRTPNVRQKTVSSFNELCKDFGNEFHFEDYYDFNHLPLNSRIRMQKQKESGNDNQTLLIHTGIPSIEEAIRLYANKYARTMKVKDLVDSFNKRLNELKAVADIQDRIKNNEEEKEKLDNEIDFIENQVRSGQSAKEYAKLIDEIDISNYIQNDVNEYVDSLQNKINDVIRKYTNATKVPVDTAKKEVLYIENQYKDLQVQLEVKINNIFDISFKRTFETIIKLYQSRLSDLGLKSEGEDIVFNPKDFVGQELSDLDKIFSKYTTPDDQGRFEKVTETKTRTVERSKWNPKRWFGSKYTTESYEDTVKKWKAKLVDVVNMKEVVDEYFVSLQVELDNAKIKVPKQINKETIKIKDLLKVEIGKIEQVLMNKLDELKNKTDVSRQTEAEIKKQLSDLQWMTSIINKVNELINY